MKSIYKQKKTNEDGQVMMIVMILVLSGCLVMAGGLLALVRGQVRVVTELSLSKTSYILAEGALEEVVYRHMNNMSVANTETLTKNGIDVETTSTNVSDDIEVLAVGDDHGRIRKVEALLIEGDGKSFSFGVQTDNGGMLLENNSSINGNIYSNGPIIGSNLNDINGAAISAGPSGYISEIHATDSMYANSIEDSYVEGDAYYTTIDAATVVTGTKYPGFPDLATTTLPITDNLLDDWEAYAASSSVMSAECAAAGGHLIYTTDVTLGPAKIPCDVSFDLSPKVTVSGVLWIEGDLDFSQGPEFYVDPAIGNKSIPIIVDDPSDRTNSGTILMQNSGDWIGNGNRSYLLLVSRNEDAELGGSNAAIEIEQSNGGALLVYAGHGEILLENNTDLTEITAFRVHLRNNTEVNYDTGLASAIFYIGPGGGYTIDTWEEVE